MRVTSQVLRGAGATQWLRRRGWEDQAKSRGPERTPEL